MGDKTKIDWCDASWNPVTGCSYHGGWAWRIEDPVKFDNPLPLSYFGLKRPPQSWQYVNAI